MPKILEHAKNIPEAKEERRTLILDINLNHDVRHCNTDNNVLYLGIVLLKLFLFIFMFLSCRPW